ncbi:hypothetical protein QR680_017719 [Steinernema hermaphroditum]|uniref:Uncharacterized protein n=1 Tax=Steinernema hermaphroditum TaxID=289476 RepID=A0AA39HG85_9BILA|nr:hypothetical protein QR680_017719 [Steinernema hermaphroditum]
MKVCARAVKRRNFKNKPIRRSSIALAALNEISESRPRSARERTSSRRSIVIDGARGEECASHVVSRRLNLSSSAGDFNSRRTSEGA